MNNYNYLLIEETPIKFSAHNQTSYAFYTVTIVLSALISLLMWEYYYMRQQAEKLNLLRAQYSAYIDSVNRLFEKKGFTLAVQSNNVENELPDEEDEEEMDSFLVLNRSASYLKESTESYLKNNHLDTVMSTMSPHAWSDYTKQVIMGVEKPETIITVQKPAAKSKRTNQRYKAPTMQAKRVKKKPLTAITLQLPIELSQFWLSSFFGPRKKLNGKWGFHNGIDMAAHRGTLVKAAAAGVVEQAANVAGYGNTILIKHDAVYKTRYAHLDVILVQEGATIAQGALIGKVGDTGYTRKRGKDASHLHLELYEKGERINPLSLLPL